MQLNHLNCRFLKHYCVLFLMGLIVSWPLNSQGQTVASKAPKTQIMTLGSFHFDFPNLDVVKTAEEDQISVLDEPWQSEIKAIAQAIALFRPTIIAIEREPKYQQRIDSLYLLYQEGKRALGKSETQQLGYRLAASLQLNRVYCIDDPGQHYAHILSIFNEPARYKAFEDYYLQSPYFAQAQQDLAQTRISSITQELIRLNQPDYVRKRLESYLLHPFKYEETAGDFVGVDFETGRWFNRNLRIFRNIQRIPQMPGDRILLIMGADHLSVLNPLFEMSSEYELVSPLPFLEAIPKP